MGRPHAALLEVAAGRPLPRVDDVEALVLSAVEHRMGGLLFSRTQNGELRSPRRWLHALAQEDLRTRAHQQRLWKILEAQIDRLRLGGFEVATAKGVTSQARWYDRAGERPCVDVDLLVCPADVQRIEEIVRLIKPDHVGLGDVHSLVTGGHLQVIDLEVGPGLWVDLHVDLFKLGIASRRQYVISARTIPFPLPGGGRVQVPGPEMALIHFLLHLNRDRFAYLLGLVDVGRILQREDLDWSFIEGFLQTEGLEVPVYLALDTVLEVLRLPPVHRHSVGGWRAMAWKALWPARSVLQADVGAARERRRHFCLPLLTRGRGIDTLRWWGHRAFPPRPLVDLWYGPGRSPYLWRLLAGRLKNMRPEFHRP